MADKLTPEQLAEMLKSLQGQAMMSSEEAVDTGVGVDYRRNLRKGLETLRGQDPESLKAAGRQVYGMESDIPKKVVQEATDIIEVPELIKKGGAKVLPFLKRKAPAAALGGVGLLASLGAEASDSPDAGMPLDEEMQMLAEDKARKDYEKSPARQAKLQALKRLLPR